MIIQPAITFANSEKSQSFIMYHLAGYHNRFLSGRIMMYFRPILSSLRINKSFHSPVTHSFNHSMIHMEEVDRS